MPRIEHSIITMALAMTTFLGAATTLLLIGTPTVVDGMRASGPRHHHQAPWQKLASPYSSSLLPLSSSAPSSSAGRRRKDRDHTAPPSPLRARCRASGVRNGAAMRASSGAAGAEAAVAAKRSPGEGKEGARGDGGGGGGGGVVQRKATGATSTTGTVTQGAQNRRKKKRRLEPVGRADAVKLLRQAVIKFRGAQVSASSYPSSTTAPAPMPSPGSSAFSTSPSPASRSSPSFPSPSPSTPTSSSVSPHAGTSSGTRVYASSSGGVVIGAGINGGGTTTTSTTTSTTTTNSIGAPRVYASSTNGVVVRAEESSTSGAISPGGVGAERAGSGAVAAPSAATESKGSGGVHGEESASTTTVLPSAATAASAVPAGECDDEDPGTVAAEEFAELAARCLGSALPEIALEAHSLYVRAAASGQRRRTKPLLPPFPLTTDNAEERDYSISLARRDAEISLLVTAARAHIAMGGVLDGLALVDDATEIGGSFGGGVAAAALRAKGRWGGDGEAGAGLARLGDANASAITEELCVSGGSVGLRAALRLRERLSEEDRALTREAQLLLLEALAGATGRALGDVVFETTGRGLTFLPQKRKKSPDSSSSSSSSSSPSPSSSSTSSTATAAAAAATPTTTTIAQPDPAWFTTLRAVARRAWGGGVSTADVERNGSGVDLESPPHIVLQDAGGFGGAGSGGGGGGWVPIGARAAGEGRVEVDGEGALVPDFNARIAARLAQELFSEMTAGKEAGRVSSRAQASLVRAVFRSSLARSRGPAPPAAASDLADRTLTSFDEADLELALSEGQQVANKLKIKPPPPPPKTSASTKAAAAAAATATRTKTKTKTKTKAKNVGANTKDGANSKVGKPSGLTDGGSGSGSGQKTSSKKDGGGGGSNGRGGSKSAAATATVTAPIPAKKHKKKRGQSETDTGVVDAKAAAAATTTKGDSKKEKKKQTQVSYRAGELGGFWVASTLLQESLACNYTAGALTVLETMGSEGHWARASTYNTLLWYFRQERDAKGALSILQGLRESANVKPDQLSYTLAIQACVWSGSCVEEAWSIVEEAEAAEDSSFVSKDLLDARLILVQAVGGDVLEGLKEMSARGVTADESTLLGVIEACAQRGDTEGAMDILQMMRGAAAAAAAKSSTSSKRKKATMSYCPRPSYRSYLAALTACSRALPPESERSGHDVGAGEAREGQYQGGGGGGGEARGDWRASKEVLRMMWEDEAARAANADVAVPGTWSPGLQEALSLGPSHVTMPAVPDATCYQLAMECCVSCGRVDEALALLAEMESHGLNPNEAALRALIRGFAQEGLDESAGSGGPGAGSGRGGAMSAAQAERRWKGVENALGVFEELAERFDPPSRASFEQAIDACISHPDGLQHAGDLISRMKAVGHDLQADHYNVLIRGFGDARNLGAALNVFQTMREGVAVGGPGGGARGRTLGWEVEEDMFAALVGACTRSGEAENVSEAIGFLRMNGVNPPSEILSYLQNDEFESELYDEIFGEKDRLAGKAKDQRSRGRKYGTHALAAHLIGSGGTGSGHGAAAFGVEEDATEATGGTTGAVVSRGSDGGSSISRDSGSGRSKGDGGGGKGGGQRREEITFAEAVLDSLRRAEARRTKSERVEEDGGAFPGNPRHPVGWVGTFKETFTHAERKEEALKRRAGEARSRERRRKRQEAERLAAIAAAGGSTSGPGNGLISSSTGTSSISVNAIPKSIDKPKGGFDGAAEGSGGDRRAGGALSSHRRRRRGGGGGKGDSRIAAAAAAAGGTRSEPRRRPLLVKTGGGGSSGSFSEESSPALEAVVAGLRRKGTNSKARSRRGSGMSIVPSQPSVRRKEKSGGAGGSASGGKVKVSGKDKGKSGGGGGSNAKG